MSLRSNCIRVTETFGLHHQLMLRNLRNYIKGHTEESLIKEINKLESASYLRTLWEAGLTQALQDAVLERLKRVV